MKPHSLLCASVLVSSLGAQAPAPIPPAPAQAPAAQALSGAELAVQRFMDGYNAHDARAVANACGAEAQFLVHPGTVLYDGRDAVYKAFTEAFRKNSKAHCEVLHRSVLRQRVVDELLYTGLGKEPIHSVVIYEIQNDLVQVAWLVPSN